MHGKKICRLWGQTKSWFLKQISRFNPVCHTCVGCSCHAVHRRGAAARWRGRQSHLSGTRPTWHGFQQKVRHFCPSEFTSIIPIFVTFILHSHRVLVGILSAWDLNCFWGWLSPNALKVPTLFTVPFYSPHPMQKKMLPVVPLKKFCPRYKYFCAILKYTEWKQLPLFWGTPANTS